mgnify:CR=1 FL=1
MGKEKNKTIAIIIIGLILLQTIRITLELSVFCFIERTKFTDTVVSALIMALLIFIGIILAKKKDISLSVFPQKYKLVYAAATIIVSALIILTPIITEEQSLLAVSSLVYSSIITPIFEELIFRGYVWNKLEKRLEKKLTVYVVTTLLFAFWHIGYIDTILFKVDINNVPFVMLMKVITGLCFGIILGAVRYKTRNCYSTILLHSLMNIFGR